MKGTQLCAICFSWIVVVATSNWSSLLDNNSLVARPCILPVKYHGWMYSPRGGSNDKIQSDNETDAEKKADDASKGVNPKDDQEKEEEWEEPPSRDAWTEDEDVGESELDDDGVEIDTEMFLTAQEFVNNESVPEEIDEGYRDADEYQDSLADIEADATDVFHAEEVKSPMIGDFQEDEIIVAHTMEMEEDEDDKERSGDYTDDEADVEQAGLSTMAPSIEKEGTTSSAIGDRKEWQDMFEDEIIEEVATFVTATQATDESRIEMDIAHHHSTDDDSMAFVDRMELADDEGETMLNGLSGESMRESNELLIVDDTAIESVDENAHTRVEELDKMSTHDSRVIDNETERILTKELNFRPHEVARMTPEIALVLAEKRLYRPLEGIPKNWYKDDSPGKQNLASRKAKKYIFNMMLLPRYAFPIVLGGLAVYGYVDLVEMFAKLFAELTPEHLQNKSEDENVNGDEDEKALNTDGELPPSSVTAGGIVYDIAPMAPGVKQSYSRAWEDETWLDKVITRISESIKKFLSIEI